MTKKPRDKKPLERKAKLRRDFGERPVGWDEEADDYTRPYPKAPDPKPKSEPEPNP